MCGIAGIVGADGNREENARRGLAMLRQIRHRGPDGEGDWSEAQGRAWLGHRRLAIIDVAGGRQPLPNEDETIWVSFNGCIYNFHELRQELETKGHTFRTRSDTEVIVHAYEAWGEECVSHFNGMWSFALWDGRRSRLFCSRDRLGIKPFYFAEISGRLIFASEIKALLATGLLSAQPDPAGLRQYLTFQFCLGERTLFSGIRRLPPGHNLSWEPGQRARVWSYWDLHFEINDETDEDRLAERLRWLLEDAVRLRLRSDVPLGAHLSGGLDSSVIVALTRKHLPAAHLNTFTGAFAEGRAFDEREYAREMAAHADAEPLELVLTAQDFIDQIERIIWHMDEPAAGPGVFPQFGVSRLASQHVKVVLGGQGGDELFIGYARYLVAYLEECLKGAVQDTAARGEYVATLSTIVPSLPSLQNYMPMLRRFWERGLFDLPARRYFRLMDRFEGVAPLLHRDFPVDAAETYEEFAEIFASPAAASMINRIMFFDLKTHLQSLLHVEDRTSMAWGLESRVPLLDYRIVELMAAIQPVLKFKNGQLKFLFRKAIGELVPASIQNRRDKMGFPVPLTDWFQGVLREPIRDILGGGAARARGVFDQQLLLQTIEREAAFGRTAWGALCLELWYRRFVDTAPAAVA